VHFMKLASARGFRPRPKLPRLFSEFTRARVTQDKPQLFSDRLLSRKINTTLKTAKRACLSSDTVSLIGGFLHHVENARNCSPELLV
jgi:hypothetical protein